MANKRYVYYQPNAKDLEDKFGDCSIRALTKFFGREWIEIFNDLVAYAQKNQCMPNMLPNIQEYLADKNVPYEKTYKPKAWHKETVLDFAKAHQEGKFILYCRVGYGTHLVAVEDGAYYDTWDCGDRIVYGYWEMTATTQTDQEQKKTDSKYDKETICELVKRLESHYPHSYSTLKTIYKEASAMMEEE